MVASSLKYFLYCRKSTEQEDQQALSIDAQLTDMKMVAEREGLTIVGIFTESKSAKEPGRPIFNDMIRRIERGEANAVLTWKLDRLARNFDDGGRIIGLLQRGVIQEIRAYEKSYLPADNVLMIAVELGMANQYVRDLSVNIRRGIREKIRRGIYNGKAPLGYMNEPKLRTIEPDPAAFPKIKRCLEDFSRGQCSLTGFQRALAAEGIIGNRSGKPIPLSSIDKLLRNPFYYGVFVHKGEMHQGVHVPMISKQTFDEIQKALVMVGKPRKRRGEKGFRFLNFATCGSCGYCITGERHVKKSGRRFLYYRCTHKNRSQRCEGRVYIREEKMAEEVKRNVELVVIPEEWKERFLARIETWEGESSRETDGQIEKLKGELNALKARMDRINTAFADGSLDIQEFKKMKNPMVAKKTELEQQITVLEKTRANRLEPLKNWILHANQAKKWVFEENWVEMKSFLQKVGSNHLLRDQTLTVSFKKPWNLLAETIVAVRSTASASERNSKWWTRADSNR